MDYKIKEFGCICFIGLKPPGYLHHLHFMELHSMISGKEVLIIAADDIRININKPDRIPEIFEMKAIPMIPIEEPPTWREINEEKKTKFYDRFYKPKYKRK